MLSIAYESEDFPAGMAVTNGSGNLKFTWNDLLHSAITIGRPSRQAVFQNGNSSYYEAIFRTSLIRMALEQHGPKGTRLYRTNAAKTLDPTEKGAVNYFIGMAVSGMFCRMLLEVDWPLHLDTFGKQLHRVLTTRSRPDLIGEDRIGQWVSIEAKGRISQPDNPTKHKAKDQASRCLTVDGIVPTYHLGTIAYLKRDVLTFYWIDPEYIPNKTGKNFNIELNPNIWREHYRCALALYEQENANNTGVKVDFHPLVLRLLREKKWENAKYTCQHERDVFTSDGYFPDGIKLHCDEHYWSGPYTGWDDQIT